MIWAFNAALPMTAICIDAITEWVRDKEYAARIGEVVPPAADTPDLKTED